MTDTDLTRWLADEEREHVGVCQHVRTIAALRRDREELRAALEKATTPMLCDLCAHGADYAPRRQIEGLCEPAYEDDDNTGAGGWIERSDLVAGCPAFVPRPDYSPEAARHPLLARIPATEVDRG